jgi:hypothetical protein
VLLAEQHLDWLRDNGHRIYAVAFAGDPTDANDETVVITASLHPVPVAVVRYNWDD